MGNKAVGGLAEKAVDTQVGGDTWCPDMGIKIRLLCFGGLYIFGKCQSLPLNLFNLISYLCFFKRTLYGVYRVYWT